MFKKCRKLISGILIVVFMLSSYSIAFAEISDNINNETISGTSDKAENSVSGTPEPRFLALGIPLIEWLGVAAYNALLLTTMTVTISDMGTDYEFAPAENLEKSIRKEETKYWLAYCEAKNSGVLVGNQISAAQAEAVLIDSRELAEISNFQNPWSPNRMGNVLCNKNFMALAVAMTASQGSNKGKPAHHSQSGVGNYNHYHVMSDRYSGYDGERYRPHVWYLD